MLISVVIPVKDDAEELARCLSALHKQSRRPDEIVVVDNGCRDHSVAVALAHGARVITEPRPGIPRAASAGYDAARGGLILRLDADSIPPRHWVGAMAARFDDPSIDAVSAPGRFRGPVGHGLLQHLYMGGYFVLMGAALAHPPLFGSNLGMRSSAWHAVSADIDRDDAMLHDDVDLSLHLGREHRIVHDRRIVVAISARPLDSTRTMLHRFRRGFHTLRRHPGPLRRWRDWLIRTVPVSASTPAPRLPLVGVLGADAVAVAALGAVLAATRPGTRFDRSTLAVGAALGWSLAVVGFTVTRRRAALRRALPWFAAGGAVTAAGAGIVAATTTSRTARRFAFGLLAGDAVLSAGYLMSLRHLDHVTGRTPAPMNAPKRSDEATSPDDAMTFDEQRTDQLTRAPKSTEADAAPRIRVSSTESGRTRIDVADTASVRPGDPAQQNG